MYSIELMVEEHNDILRFNQVMRKACFKVLHGSEVPVEDFRVMIDFVRTYADKHHHGKEEKILFKEMQDHLGPIGTKLITHGMLVEHDLGRLHMSDLETALDEFEKTKEEELKLDIIASAVGYTKLLKRHIDKENEVVYTYGAKNLSPEILASVDERVKAFEEEAMDHQVQEHYSAILKELEEKYL
ncbi:MAG TPA: hemerythrin domain-containing protein [Candidatus Merdenecus merdavium]|nr:hemerythrin domain-containing protein [Candidatus Merdenecus merdavium]